jgi:hypothetical protein
MDRSIFKKLLTLYYIYRQLRKEERFRLLFKKVGIVLKKMNGFLRPIVGSCKEKFGKATWKKIWNLIQEIF